jgi:hypothetical protein
MASEIGCHLLKFGGSCNVSCAQLRRAVDIVSTLREHAGCRSRCSPFDGGRAAPNDAGCADAHDLRECGVVASSVGWIHHMNHWNRDLPRARGRCDGDELERARVPRLVNGSVHGPAGRPAWIDHMISSISAGAFQEVRAELAGLSREDPVVALLDADVRVRTFDTSTAELLRVRAEIERIEQPGGALSAWAAAQLAEHLLANGDPATFVVAATALQAMPDDLLPPMPLAYARARLLRVMAAAWMASAVEDLEPSWVMCREAVTLLRRYGLVEEAVATSGIVTGFVALLRVDDPFSRYEQVREARAAIGLHDVSLWPVLLDGQLAFLAMLVRDLGAAREALDRLARAVPSSGPLASVPVRGRACLRLLAEGPSPGALDAVRAAMEDPGDEPWARSTFQRLVADVLADWGHREACSLGRAGLLLPAFGPVEPIENALLAKRFDMIDGTVAPHADDLLPMLEDLVEAGRTRAAAYKALQLAHDLGRCGSAADADRLHRWGRERFPPARLLPDELMALRPLGQPMATTGPPPPADAPVASNRRLVLRVLVPRLDARVEGRDPLELTSVEATLLILLVHAYPAPIPVDVAHEALWPGREVHVPRLNTAVHRLRRRLATVERAVVRRADELSLDDRLVQADLWDYRAQLAAAGPDRVRALASVRGNLCDADLPSAAALVELRRGLADGWSARARAAVAEGLAHVDELLPAAAALGCDLRDVSPAAGPGPGARAGRSPRPARAT